jgi:hypothetical protein
VNALLLVLFAVQDSDFYEAKIRPLLAERCSSCHGEKSEKLKGELKLDSPAGIRKGGANGPVVAAGDPDRSALVVAARWADEATRMPPKKRMPPEEVALLEEWVRRGAPLPADRPPTAAAPEAALTHWAFQPVRDAAPPPAAGALTDVDRFVFAKLESKGLHPNPPADPRTLLRRLSYDLTGLPPSAEELDAFAAAPDLDRAVEKLLASPAYGERWGRHWLDVARYADTKGYVYAGRDEPRFVHAWVYRDWVVRAFNEDLPYDRFLALQIAADRLGAGSRDLPAMGFLTVGRRFINNIHDIIDDRIDTLGRGMLGLSLSCARCHDHKFDPVPIEDYYSLYGMFASSRESTKPAGELPAGAEGRAYSAEREKRRAALETLFERKRKELLARIRSQAAMYFEAAAEAEKLPTEEFYQLLDANEVNPVFARQWAQSIWASQKDFHPVFAPWHALKSIPEKELAAKGPAWVLEQRDRLHPRIVQALLETPAPSTFKEVARRYGRAFTDPAAKDLAAILQGEFVTFPPGAISEVEWFFDEGTRVELGKAQVAIDQLALQHPGAPPYAAVLEDRPAPATARVFRRGNPANKGAEVPRQVLGLLEPGRKPVADGSGRLELARSIVDPANPLTARVWANRVWMHHFGRGIVATPSDFGLRAEAPSHPELLDFLARFLVKNGWSTKALHRLIVRSAAYRQSSADQPAARLADPENRLLWRMNRRRLDLEQMRDSILLASGKLDPALGGRPTSFDAPRRTLYGLVDRLNVPSMLRTFDFTNVDAHSPQRHLTTVPQQALYLLNSPFLVGQARALAGVVPEGPPESKVALLYRRLLGRAPDAPEVEVGVRWLSRPSAPRPEWKPGVWQYGYGEAGKGTFTPLPHFTGSAWQGGPAWPDAALGWVQLTAKGGHTGNDFQHDAIRRWTAPEDLTVSISGLLAHRPAAGNGVRARILHSGRGELASWTLKTLEAESRLQGLPVKKGETIDFVVDFNGMLDSNEFLWAPVIKAGKDKEWNAEKDFGGPPPAALTSLERYAQTLLVSNEFFFLD